MLGYGRSMMDDDISKSFFIYANKVLFYER